MCNHWCLVQLGVSILSGRLVNWQDLTYMQEYQFTKLFKKERLLSCLWQVFVSSDWKVRESESRDVH